MTDTPRQTPPKVVRWPLRQMVSATCRRIPGTDRSHVTRQYKDGGTDEAFYERKDLLDSTFGVLKYLRDEIRKDDKPLLVLALAGASATCVWHGCCHRAHDIAHVLYGHFFVI